MSYITSGTIRIWWESTGSGSPVLLINGLGSISTAWHRLLPRLADEFRVITFDNRGVGRSGVPAEPYTLAEMSSDAVAVLDAAGVEGAHVVGMSLGGLIAQDLALQHSSRVQSLVLASTHRGLRHLGAGDPEVVRLLTAAGSLPPAERAAALVPIQHSADTPADRIARDHEVGTAYPSTPEGFASQLAAAATWDRAAELPLLEMPVLVVHGRDDRLVPLAAGRALAGAITGAELRIIDRSGHQVFTDGEVEVADAIRAFLRLSDGVGAGAPSATTNT